jgi:uncharacterized protein YjiS (DUF1127 family)
VELVDRAACILGNVSLTFASPATTWLAPTLFRHSGEMVLKQSTPICAASQRTTQKMSMNTASWDAGTSQRDNFLTRLATLADAVLRARARRRTQGALADLDDHILDDIGINPATVHRHHQSMTEWVIQSHSGTARLVFIGR